MRQILRAWIADADTRQSAATFDLSEPLSDVAYQEGRLLDLYTSLVGELFDLLRAEVVDDARDWPTVANGLALIGAELRGRTRADAFFFSAAAYYLGGLSASAYLTMRRADPSYWDLDSFRACYDLLARPIEVSSDQVAALLVALAEGTSEQFGVIADVAAADAVEALQIGPDQWVSSRILHSLIDTFRVSNVRAVLPDGDARRWTPLVASFLNRRPPVWDFFPSQIEAIASGMLASEQTFSMQMPTGSGKTALTETLIYNHLTDRPADLAVLLVPFRSLARELRNSTGRRLTQMGFPTRTVYGGTVPAPEETQDLDAVRVIIATPEAMTGLLGSAPTLAERISLLVCDEGHLLDSAGRGIGLELLLARFLARGGTSPRIVFVSAVVPNIEEINSWLGGNAATVVRSDFRPADAEYSVLRASGPSGRRLRLALELRPQTGTNLPTRTIPDFLSVAEFEFLNEATGRINTYNFNSFKTQAIAAARKALPLGTVAVFTRTKGGDQGVIALAAELAEQLTRPLRLPRPIDYTGNTDRLRHLGDYLAVEYGPGWVGTVALAVGAVVHHGDIPQETREALEEALVANDVRMVLCTGTLAEGVNLPIRTLVVYTTQVRTADGSIPMLAREIRNLVGRAGRPGSSTKGLVLCANANEWDVMTRIADGAPGEAVHGALLATITRLVEVLSQNSGVLTNINLEASPLVLPLVDGVDSTLIELLHEDIGADEFRRIAAALAANTYAYQQSGRQQRRVLEDVFALRAERLTELRASGRAGWAAGTGVRARLLDSIADSLVPSFDRWLTVDNPTDIEMLDAILAWAFRQPDVAVALRETYPDVELIGTRRLPARADLLEQLRLWLSGRTFAAMAEATSRDIDRLLRIHAGVVSYALTTVVEQAVTVLEQIFTSTGDFLAPAVVMLPDFMRYGVSSVHARNLMVGGMRHRRAAHLLGADPAMVSPENAFTPAEDVARALLMQDPAGWLTTLGSFLFNRTASDLGLINVVADDS